MSGVLGQPWPSPQWSLEMLQQEFLSLLFRVRACFYASSQLVCGGAKT